MKNLFTLCLLFFITSASAQRATLIIDDNDSLFVQIQAFTKDSFVTNEGYIKIASVRGVILHDVLDEYSMVKFTSLEIPFTLIDGTKINHGKKPVAGNFYLDENKRLLYERIFETDLNEVDLKNAILKKFKDFRFTVENYPINNKALGYDGLFLPLFITNAGHNFEVIIQQKKNRYRVIVSEFRARPNFTIEFGNVRSSDQSVIPLEEIVYKKNGKLRYPKSNQRGFSCYSESLDIHFDIPKSNKILDEDW